MSLRLGIFGGTFNPPHFGHLRSALETVEAADLGSLLWLPSGGHPFKAAEELAPVAHRLAMTRLAIRGEPRFKLCDLEANRPGTSFTIDTLRAMNQRYAGSRLLFVLGSDLFRELHLWKDWQLLPELADLCVLGRPGFENELRETPAAHHFAPLGRVESLGPADGPPPLRSPPGDATRDQLNRYPPPLGCGPVDPLPGPGTGRRLHRPPSGLPVRQWGSIVTRSIGPAIAAHN
ncbi:MAG: nicotinate (nicotinamide) nucleotide adenylyltransferase [Magnetococcales bacterium]|nr:nicotinate (nicotinamide) nucleotide adenylyltransferase [Magnetococcales bacterium]